MTVDAAVNASVAQANENVQQTVAIKTLKMAQDQQKSIGDLVTAAAQSAEELLSQEPGKGQNLDLLA